MLKKKDIWDKITTSLKSDISPSECKTWFSHTFLKKLDPETAVIQVPNKFIANWLHDNYLNQIRESFKDNLDFLPKIRFTYTRANIGQDSTENPSIQKSRFNLSHGLNPALTFERFTTSKSNQFSYSSAWEVANRPADQYNPLFIFSKLSLGKTHLLNAIGNYIVANNPLTNIRYLSVDRFSSDFSIAAKKRRLHEFRKHYKKLDFLLLDDIDMLSGREKSQKELLDIFNSFYDSKKQIVLAGKKPPSQIPKLLPQLKSRLEWGLLSEIQVPDQKDKIRIIKKKAKGENLNLPDDVIFFLANSTNNLKTLIQHIVSLETYASLYQRKIDMSTVKTIIKNRNSHNRITVHDIQKLTAGHFNLSVTELLSDKKKRSFSYPRQVAMYLSRKLTDLSYKEIGKEFGDKDHSTVIYAVKRIQKEKRLKKDVLDDINKLQNFLS
jgi:chromosomal replication initiator protein